MHIHIRILSGTENYLMKQDFLIQVLPKAYQLEEEIHLLHLLY